MTRQPTTLARSLMITLRTVALAAIGGIGFELLGIPVSWISGGMLFVAAAALAGVAVGIPNLLREIVFFVVGLSIGATLTPQTLTGFAAWPLSILAVVLSVPLVIGAAYVVLIWRGGWRHEDALLASAPGALTMIVALAEETGADVARIVVVQSLRIVLLVALLPPIIAAFSDHSFEFVAVAAPADALWRELPLLLLGGLAGYAGARLLRLPTPSLLGALLGSAGVHVTGIVEVPVPAVVMVPCLIVVGAVVGVRFQGVGWALLRRSLADGFLSFLATFAVSVLVAGLVTLLLGFSVGQTVLAFAPGGFDVMIVMAFALGLDAAYVAAHHAVRFIGLSVAMPLFVRQRRKKET